MAAGLAMLQDIEAVRYPSLKDLDAVLQRLGAAEREATGDGDYEVAFSLQDCAGRLRRCRPDVASASAHAAAKAVHGKARDLLRAGREGRYPTADGLEGTIHRIAKARDAMLAEQHFVLAAELADLGDDLESLTAFAEDVPPPAPAHPAIVVPVRLPRPAESAAVLIGSAEYASGAIPDLAGVRNNLSDLYDVLSGDRQGGFDPARVHRILNPGLTVAGSVATIGADITDTLLVYFAGHGTVGSDGELYLSLPGTTPGLEEYDALPYQKIRQAIVDSPARRRVVILDCCFSGRAIDVMSGGGTAPSALLDVASTYVLTSTSAVRPSYAPPGERNTAFTGALLSVLRDGVDNGESLLRITEMYKPMWRQLHGLGRPTPQQRLTGAAEDLALTRNTAWRRPTGRA